MTDLREALNTHWQGAAAILSMGDQEWEAVVQDETSYSELHMRALSIVRDVIREAACPNPSCEDGVYDSGAAHPDTGHGIDLPCSWIGHLCEKLMTDTPDQVRARIRAWLRENEPAPSGDLSRFNLDGFGIGR